MGGGSRLPGWTQRAPKPSQNPKSSRVEIFGQIFEGKHHFLTTLAIVFPMFSVDPSLPLSPAGLGWPQHDFGRPPSGVWQPTCTAGKVLADRTPSPPQGRLPSLQFKKLALDIFYVPPFKWQHICTGLGGNLNEKCLQMNDPPVHMN